MTSNLLGITSACEVVLQPFGAFLVNRKRNRFDVVNKTGTGLLLALNHPMSRGDAVQWGANRGQQAGAVEALLAALQERGYVGEPTPPPGPRISFVEHPSVLKATRADVEVTNRCNLKCVYCYAEVNRSKDELSAEQWIEVLGGMYRHGLRAVLFSGGEPFLHRGFVRMLEWAAPRLVVEINSNGTYITDQIAARLAEFDIKQVQISMDSATADYHDSVRGKGSHARALSAIRKLVAMGVPTQVSAVVTSANRPLMADLAKLTVELGVRFKGDPVTRTGFARDIPDQQWEQDFAVSRDDRVASPNPEAEIGFEPLCQSQVGYVAVSHQGILKPCNMREQFFEATGGVLLHEAATKWWDGFYGSTRLAELASTASTLDQGRAEELQRSESGYLCELQLAVADKGHRRSPVPVKLSATRQR
ncbi:radical SAM protein [Actinomadura terrae]|uniref:radical SAM protein n=1 Tax=Actinomadura terrae TaxID=604353 RepID=UPI001FA751BD|nr:radical SAM protein [Actinomadura terrae]